MNSCKSCAFFYFKYAVILCALQLSNQASFYGSSYVKLPVQDASSSTNIYIRFKTHRSDALLLLAAGTTDYCLVTLQDGAVKVRINLGAGESELSSVTGLRLDDLVWHEIEIQRDDAEISLIIDAIHTTHLFIPGSFYELNIHFGIFCGGLGDFSDLFLGNLNYFRGCMDEVSFNDYDVLGTTEKTVSHLVTWDCSDEFDGVEESSISFMDNSAFLALPQMTARTGGSISFDIKTQTQTAVLIYHSGIPSKSDFVAVELVNGMAQLLVNKGNGVVPVLSNVTISDGYWHNLFVTFGPEELDLTVDSISTNVRTSQRGNRFIDLNGYLYIGGIEINKQSRALRQGLESVDQEGTESSMRGCIRDLKVNRKTTSLLEAEVTQSLRSGCVWDYPCLLSPCIEGADCYQESFEDFRCFCDAGELCIRQDFNQTYTVYTKSTLPVDMEILYLHPLQVPEGGSELITTDLIQVTLDYQRYGVRESGVMFHIIEPPKYGALEVEIYTRSSENVFSLSDLNTDKIRYSHYGSDNHHDTITFEIEFKGHSHRLPPFLEHNHKFVFHINVQPVNDPPRLVIPQDKILRLAAKTKKLITSEYLQATDTDSSPSELIYTLIKVGSNEMGFVENVKNPGVPIDEFSQLDVNNELISYVHRGLAKNSRLAMRISDGIESGDMAVLRVATFDLYISLGNNTGLTVIHGASAIISPVNLTFITNAIDQQLDISYDITRMPQHGTVQKLKSSGRWQVTSRFTQRQIDHQQIRYVHAGNSRPKHDQFKFVVSSMSTKESTMYEFTITFITVNVEITGSKLLELQHVNQAKLIKDVLNIETEPNISKDSDIGFHLVYAPIHGEVFVKGYNGQMSAQKPFGDDFSFTLQDIAHANVFYTLNWRMYVPMNDSFELMAVTPGGIRNNIVINISHIPKPSDVHVVMEPVTVTEGQRVTIGADNLQVTEPNVTSFMFNITDRPRHGSLLLLNDMLTKPEIQKPDVVSSGHIKSNRLVYVHDNSESAQDSFNFVAFAGEWSNSKTAVHGSLAIQIRMTNDNPPYRVVDKPFYVVRSGKRIITSSDVLYADDDIDTKSNDIRYTRRGISNGAMVSAKNPEIQIYQFTQADINEGNIMFKHQGDLEGRTVLWVTDGQFYTTGILEINASDPFLVVSVNKAPIVKHGDSKTIRSSNLATTTNVDVKPEEIMFTITKPAKYGQVTRRGIGSLQFTQADLDRGLVDYESDTALEFVDSFDFEVSAAGKISSGGTFKINIYPESYWKPFEVVRNETLNVSEGKWKWIDQSVLKILHANVDPNDIVYHVTSPPRYGTLFIRNFKHVTTFNQATIDEQSLKYEQNSGNATSDTIVFNVTNGVITLSNISLAINIIPSRVHLLPGLIKVLEGDKLALELDMFAIGNSYYAESVRDYLITTKPRYGRFQNKRKPKKRITRFSPSQVRRGLIYYIHDGSETQKDRFSIVAVVSTENGMIRSSPGHIDVVILPVDDQPPKLVNNTGLVMWSGLTVALSSSMLAAVDVDSQKSDIYFRIIKSSDIGYFGLVTSPDQFLTSIPQLKIDSGDVRFFHTGGNEGSYVFELTDKVNTQRDYVTFNIRAKPIELSMKNIGKLQVFPQMQAIVSSKHLKVMASGNISSQNIIYEVTKAPSHGKLLIKQGKVFDHVTEFTQEELDKNLILYQSIGKQYVNDHIVFHVTNEYSQKTLTVNFEIEISSKISKENLHGIVKPVEVMEGGRAIISEVNVNITGLLHLIPSASEEYLEEDARLVIDRQPEHGYIICRGEKLDQETGHCELAAKDLVDGKLVYQHDHSDTFSDSLEFTVKLIENTNAVVDLVNITLDINLIPVNDNNFKLVTNAPKINVIYGMKTKLTDQNLKTEDPDGIPEAIVYEVISRPNNGKISLEHQGKLKIVRKFTQKDIDEGKVYFVHDRQTNSRDIFNIKVSDGSPNHKSVYRGCAVNVLPLTLSVVNRTDVELTQGTTTIALSTGHINIATNGNSSNTIYRVEGRPMYGDIIMNGKQVNEFLQQDLDRQRVMYSQKDLSGSQDNFTVTITNMIAVLSHQVIHLKVLPLLNQRTVPVASAHKTYITLNHLDASELARQTDSNPMYSILLAPEHGILQRARERPYRSTDSLKSFTHSDIKNRDVYYKSLPNNRQEDQKDKIMFLLSAPNVQPAAGEIEIDFKSSSTHSTPDVIENTGKNSGSEVDVNYMLIIAVVVSLLVFFIIIIIVIVRCLRKSKSSSKKYQQQKKYAPKHKNGYGVSDDLPPPPTALTPPVGKVKRKQFLPGSTRAMTPPPIGMYSEDEDFAEISAAVPMCKVIPLTDHHLSDCHNVKPQYDDPDSLYSDDLSSTSNGGNDNHWSGLGHQETQFSPPSNPLLRKNQYWV